MYRYLRRQAAFRERDPGLKQTLHLARIGCLGIDPQDRLSTGRTNQQPRVVFQEILQSVAVVDGYDRLTSKLGRRRRPQPCDELLLGKRPDMLVDAIVG